MSLNYNQRLQFVSWQNDANPVPVICYKDHPEIARLVTEFRKRMKPKVGHCYFNSAVMLWLQPDVRYECGFAYNGSEFIKHAWNSFRGIHFDVTDYVARRLYLKKLGMPFEPLTDYRTLFSLDHRQHHEMQSLTLGYDDYHKEYWRRHVLGDPAEVVRRNSKPFLERAPEHGMESGVFRWSYDTPKWTPIRGITASESAATK